MKRKHFYVVNYDISNDRRRDKVVKFMESVGTSMNYSVFECMLTDIQFRKMNFFNVFSLYLTKKSYFCTAKQVENQHHFSQEIMPILNADRSCEYYREVIDIINILLPVRTGRKMPPLQCKTTPICEKMCQTYPNQPDT